MDIFSDLERLALPLGQYVVVGGGCMMAHGLRDTRGLDIVVLPKLFEHLRHEGWAEDPVYRQKWNRERLKRGEVEVYPDMNLSKEGIFVDVAELIGRRRWFVGIPFCPCCDCSPSKRMASAKKIERMRCLFVNASACRLFLLPMFFICANLVSYVRTYQLY